MKLNAHFVVSTSEQEGDTHAIFLRMGQYSFPVVSAKIRTKEQALHFGKLAGLVVALVIKGQACQLPAAGDAQELPLDEIKDTVLSEVKKRM